MPLIQNASFDHVNLFQPFPIFRSWWAGSLEKETPLSGAPFNLKLETSNSKLAFSAFAP
jgi:hypothetical protein